MKPEEAIEILSIESMVVSSVIGFCNDFEGMSGKALEVRLKRRDALETAIEALKEVQKYREIGTVEECREAVEKQKPKKIYHEKWNGIDGVPYDLCPTCKNNLCTTGVLARHKMNYCENCGQKLCWDENLEGMEDDIV